MHSPYDFAYWDKYYHDNKKYKHMGVKVWQAGSNYWMRQNEDGSYTFDYVYSKNFYDDKGVYRKATAGERDKYSKEPVAQITRDERLHINTLATKRVSVQRIDALLYNWSLCIRKNKSIKELGYRVSRYLNYEEVSSVVSSGLVTYDPLMKTLETKCPPLQRTWNKNKQKELNERIRWAKRMFKLRAKLGAYNGLNMADEFKKAEKEWGYRREVLGSDEKFYAMMMNIKEEDVMSVIPALYVFWSHWLAPTSADVDWITVFERGIENNREQLRRVAGAVSYERTETT